MTALKDQGSRERIEHELDTNLCVRVLRDRVRQWRVQQGEDLNRAPMPEDARTGEIRYAG